ncbi:alpha/beta hydrolase [Seonamhaeicola sp. NFXS20]|uniref:alpha/beta hydrolase n=1 Tax=Seonamhaeicola sp. NFXS20 TaxID=2816959 RepID=UPI003B8C3D89
MKYAFLNLIIFFSCLVEAQSNNVIELWPNKVSGETQPKQEAKQTNNTTGNVIRLTDITNPILTVYKPKKPNGSKAGIIICPGGGYKILAINKEGTEIAKWLNSLGYTAFVLQYRVPQKREGALQDLQRAIKWVRSNTALYNLDDERIGVMGFSAGGHLAANASLNFQKQSYMAIDSIDKASSQVNFTMLIYPAYLDKGEHNSLSPELKIGDKKAPYFIFGTIDDPYGNSSLVFTTALRNNKIPVELHMLPKGGHGYGLRKGKLAAETWPVLAEKWLQSILSQ